MLKRILIFSILLFTETFLLAQGFSGNYQLVNNSYSATLQLSTQNEINYTGSISGTMGQIQITGVLNNGILSGNIQSQQGNSYFALQPNAGKFLMTVMNYNMLGQPIPTTANYLYFQKTSAQQAPTPLANQSQSNPREIYFNGIKANENVISQLENYYKVKAQNGRYWYDKVSGMWGVEGDRTYGVLLPNLPLGGTLQANASNGNTGIFINGRNLPQTDLAILQSVTGYLQPGRYWIDAQGNAGKEGGPALVNLRQMTNQKNGGGGSTFYRNSYTGLGGGSSGGTSYVIGKDFSYISGN